MKTQFLELTPKEIFFGNAPKFNSAATGALLKTAAASQVIMQPAPIPSFNTNLIGQQQAAFIFQDFLWKYRWEIGIGIVVITAGYIIYYNEQQKKKRIGM